MVGPIGTLIPPSVRNSRDGGVPDGLLLPLPSGALRLVKARAFMTPAFWMVAEVHQRIAVVDLMSRTRSIAKPNRTVKSYNSSVMARSNASRKNGMIVRRSSAVRTTATCETRLSPCAILMKYGALALRPR